MKNHDVAEDDHDKKFVYGSQVMKSNETTPERFSSISGTNPERFSSISETTAERFSSISETTPERFSSISETVSSFQSPNCCSSSYGTPTSKTSKEEMMGQMKKNDKTHSNFAYRICDHVKMGAKFSETVKGKLSLGARIIQQGGRENIFKQMFGLREGEDLLKASQCYLSTTSGPMAGILFTSTEKIAFCSERSITFSSSNGQFIRKPYKVLIPIKKIKMVHQSENLNKPEQKYVEIVTVDDFEFWFMGFLRFEKAFKNLQKAISKPHQV